jgi:hypothetical protein
MYFPIVTSSIRFCYYNRTHETGKVVKEKGLFWLTVWKPRSMVLGGAQLLGRISPSSPGSRKASECDGKQGGTKERFITSNSLRPQLLRTEFSLRVTSSKAPLPTPGPWQAHFNMGFGKRALSKTTAAVRQIAASCSPIYTCFR